MQKTELKLETNLCFRMSNFLLESVSVVRWSDGIKKGSTRLAICNVTWICSFNHDLWANQRLANQMNKANYSAC